MAGRGRDAVLPSWMTSNGIEAANSFNPQVPSYSSEQYGDSAPVVVDAPSTPRDFDREKDRGRDRDRDRYVYNIMLTLIVIAYSPVFQVVIYLCAHMRTHSKIIGT